MRYLKDFLKFLKALVSNRKLLFDLVKNDLKSRYVKDYLGIIWAFVQPIILIFVLWFVFQIGFRAQPVMKYPFILFLASGLIPWFFFSDCILNGTNSVKMQDFLVKKVVFRVSLLPIVQITSALVIHLFFIVFLVNMFLIYGFVPDLYNLQIIYYLFYAIIFLLGFSWFSSSVILFFSDLGQLINVFLSFGIWLTPILWNFDMVPEKYRFYFKLNPVFYIVNGYRDSFMYKEWFWNDIAWGIYYWAVALIIFVFGAFVFRRLRPHFADVL